uniref:Uncharacterized protein n=1 Tax=Arundo donax TaxID=35708 RepID=A0A0A9E5X6_ARUDO
MGHLPLPLYGQQLRTPVTYDPKDLLPSCFIYETSPCMHPITIVLTKQYRTKITHITYNLIY